jgi:hypothetical protein
VFVLRQLEMVEEVAGTEGRLRLTTTERFELGPLRDNSWF